MTEGKADMRGRTCLVTGATDGHGKAVAIALAARGADVVLHARSREKALAVRDEVARAGGGKAPEILLADLARADEIEAAVAELSRERKAAACAGQQRRPRRSRAAARTRPVRS